MTGDVSVSYMIFILTPFYTEFVFDLSYHDGKDVGLLQGVPERLLCAILSGL